MNYVLNFLKELLPCPTQVEWGRNYFGRRYLRIVSFWLGRTYRGVAHADGNRLYQRRAGGLYQS